MRKTETKQKKERKKQAPKKTKVLEETKEDKFPLPLLSYKSFKDVQDAVEKREIAFGVRPQAILRLVRSNIMKPSLTIFCNFLLGPVVILFAIISISVAFYTGNFWLYFAPIPALLGNLLMSPYQKIKFFSIDVLIMIVSVLMKWNVASIMAGIFALFWILATIARVICQIKVEEIVLKNERLFVLLWNESQIYLLHFDIPTIMENLRIESFITKYDEEVKKYNQKDEEAKRKIDAKMECDKWLILYNTEYNMYKNAVFETYYIAKIEFFFIALAIILLCKSFYIFGIISILAYMCTTIINQKAIENNWYYGKNTFTKHTNYKKMRDF